MFSQIRFQNKLMTYYLTITLLVIAVLYGFISLYFLRDIRDRTQDNISQLSSKVTQSVDDYIRELNYISIRLAASEELKNALDEPNIVSDGRISFSLSRQLGRIISEAIGPSIRTSNVYVFGTDRQLLYAYAPILASPSFPNSGIGQLGSGMRFSINEGQDPTLQKRYFSLYRQIGGIFDRVYGYVELQQDYSDLQELSAIGKAGDVLLFDPEGDRMYPAPQTAENDELNDFGEKLSQMRDGSYNGKGSMRLLVSTAADSGWRVVLRYSERSVMAPFYDLQRVTILIVAALTVGSILSVFLVSRSLVLPIRKLRNLVLNWDTGDDALHVSKKLRNNEVGLLQDAFHNLLAMLQTAKEKELKSQAEEMKAKFAALQTQIAPHFIHNTLYLITIAAHDGETGKIVQISKRLSRMLRYAMRPDFSEVTLEEEFDYVTSYLDILKMKYQDFLSFEVERDDSVRTRKIPALAVQPFVENSVRHGLESRKPPWMIQIRSGENERGWFIEVSDNGIGMAEEERIVWTEQLNRAALMPGLVGKGRGLGMLNTAARIGMMYGERFRLSITEREGGGLTIGLFFESESQG